MRSRQHRQRRGFLYLAVLFASLIVATIAVSGLSMMYRSTLRSRDGIALSHARELADSAVALGLARINNDAAWRTNYTDGVAIDEITFNEGTIQFELVDSDGDLGDDPYDSVRLRGIGRYRDTLFVRDVTLDPASGIDALGTAVTIGDDFAPRNVVLWNSDGIMAFNGHIDSRSSGSVLTANVERTGSGTTPNIVGEDRWVLDPRQLPADGWDSYYRDQGTAIDITALPRRDGIYRLERVVLHPKGNPYGEANRLGIYVIDCRKARIEIDDCRIAGTILLLDPGRGSRVGSHVAWEPAIANFPALLVDGDLELWLQDEPLSEATLGVNFNPSAFPYRGESNNDSSDRYPSRIGGLIYIDGKVKLRSLGTSRIDGLLIARKADVRSNLTVMFRDHYQTDPPPGFRVGPRMRLVPGSWQRQPR